MLSVFNEREIDYEQEQENERSLGGLRIPGMLEALKTFHV